MSDLDKEQNQGKKKSVPAYVTDPLDIIDSEELSLINSIDPEEINAKFVLTKSLNQK